MLNYLHIHSLSCGITQILSIRVVSLAYIFSVSCEIILHKRNCLYFVGTLKVCMMLVPVIVITKLSLYCISDFLRATYCVAKTEQII
jgi:hypothetical protein